MKKAKLFSFGIAARMLCMLMVGISLMLTACPPSPSDPGPKGPDKTALETAISKANAAKAGVLVGTQATVAEDISYVLKADMDAFDTAIAEAQTEYDSSDSTEETVGEAATKLAAATSTFYTKIKNDGSKNAGFSQEEMDELITAANAAKDGVKVSSKGGGDIPASQQWVTQEQLDALNAAITAAETLSDATYQALVSAISLFRSQKQNGYMSNQMVVTGLGSLKDDPDVKKWMENNGLTSGYTLGFSVRVSTDTVPPWNGTQGVD
ncbi:MAG: hypothetical protein LBM77_12770 [Spirochaetaceae bacterium]|jgi:hypothetical protein|nr:hypothetical protein [Spirochaetaceae bacterium]